MSKINKAILKVAQENPEFRRELLAELKAARSTTPLIEMKYYDLGDFGGTMRSLETWVLEVGGATWRIKDDLKRAKLRWDPRTKTWGLRTTLYAARQFGRPGQTHARIRKQQEAAYRMLKPVIKAENEIIKAENKSVTGPEQKLTLRELVTSVRRDGRIRKSLADNYGIQMEYDLKGRYSRAGDEPQIFFAGETFPIKDVLKKFGFRWESSKKAWKIPMMEYEAVKKQLIPALMRELSSLSRTAASRRPETPLEKAVWNAWDYMQGTQRFRKGFLDLAQGVGLSTGGSEDLKVYKLGDKIEKAAVRLEKQSRGWRSAYNLSLEGKIELDGKRLAKDMEKTLRGMNTLYRDIKRLDTMSYGSDIRDLLEDEIKEALTFFPGTVKSFQNAIKLAVGS